MVEAVSEEHGDVAGSKRLHQRDVDLVVLVALQVDKRTQTQRQHLLDGAFKCNLSKRLLVEAVLEANKVDVKREAECLEVDNFCLWKQGGGASL